MLLPSPLADRAERDTTDSTVGTDGTDETDRTGRTDPTDRTDRPATALRRGVHAGGLLAVLGVAVVASGQPLLFPSLGPTAYVLAVHPEAPPAVPRRVLGGHAIGTVAGFLAYHLLAGGLVVTDPPIAFSTASVRLAASATLAVAVTTAAMRATDYRHAPACATTLIVALGLLPTATDAGLILLAVAATVAVDTLLS